MTMINDITKHMDSWEATCIHYGHQEGSQLEQLDPCARSMCPTIRMFHLEMGATTIVMSSCPFIHPSTSSPLFIGSAFHVNQLMGAIIIFLGEHLGYYPTNRSTFFQLPIAKQKQMCSHFAPFLFQFIYMKVELWANHMV